MVSKTTSMEIFKGTLSNIHIKGHAQIFIEVLLFRVTKNEEQPKHPWTPEQRKNRWYSNTVEYYSVFKTMKHLTVTR